MATITPELREYFSRIGKKGGAVKSDAKAAANKLNGQKPKKRKAKRKAARRAGVK